MLPRDQVFAVLEGMWPPWGGFWNVSRWLWRENTAQLAACSCQASTPTKRAVARLALPDAPQHGRHKGAAHCEAHQKGGWRGDHSWGCRFRAIL